MLNVRPSLLVGFLLALAVAHCGGDNNGSSGGGGNNAQSSGFGGGSTGATSSGTTPDAGATCAICDKANVCCKAMTDGGACSDYATTTCELAPSADLQAGNITFCQTELQSGKALNLAACK